MHVKSKCFPLCFVFFFFLFQQGATKQTYTNPAAMDSDLLRLSLRLFKRKTVCQVPGQEKTEDSKIPQPAIQQEVCVS